MRLKNIMKNIRILSKKTTTSFFTAVPLLVLLVLLSTGCKGKNTEKQIKEQSIRALELNSNEIVATGQDINESNLERLDKTLLNQDSLSLPTNSIGNAPLETPSTRNKLEKKLDNFDTSEEKLSLARIKRYYNQGNYHKVANADISPNEYEKLYYQGISTYCLLSTPLSEAERKESIAKAKNIFKSVGVNAKQSKQKSVKMKAILWHGIMMMQYPQKEKLADVIKPFKYIEKNYPKSKVYDDALFYLARAYQLRGEHNKANEVFNKLSKVDSKKNKIYDIWYKKFAEPKKAIAFYKKKSKGKIKKRNTAQKKTPPPNSKLNAATQSKNEAKNLDKAYQMISDGKIPKNVNDTLYYENEDAEGVILEDSESFNEDEELRKILESGDF